MTELTNEWFLLSPLAVGHNLQKDIPKQLQEFGTCFSLVKCHLSPLLKLENKDGVRRVMPPEPNIIMNTMY